MGNRCCSHSVAALALAALLLLPAARVAAAGESGPVLLLGAIEAEVQPLPPALSDRGALPVLGIPCVTGTLSGRRVVVALTGVGKVNAAMTTVLLIERFAPTAVIFTGIAGGLDPDLQPGDVVIGERLVQHDLVRYTEQGRVLRTVRSPLGRAESPIVHESSPALLTLARDAASRLPLELVAEGSRPPRIRFGTIATGDSFIASSAKKTELRSETGAHACEMEGAAIAQVCHQLGVPFLVVRGLSDRAGSGAPAEARRNLGVAARNAAALALAVARALGERRDR